MKTNSTKINDFLLSEGLDNCNFSLREHVSPFKGFYTENDDKTAKTEVKLGYVKKFSLKKRKSGKTPFFTYVIMHY